MAKLIQKHRHSPCFRFTTTQRDIKTMTVRMQLPMLSSYPDSLFLYSKPKSASTGSCLSFSVFLYCFPDRCLVHDSFGEKDLFSRSISAFKYSRQAVLDVSCCEMLLRWATLRLWLLTSMSHSSPTDTISDTSCIVRSSTSTIW